jgi:hypothetical protein
MGQRPRMEILLDFIYLNLEGALAVEPKAYNIIHNPVLGVSSTPSPLAPMITHLTYKCLILALNVRRCKAQTCGQSAGNGRGGKPNRQGSGHGNLPTFSRLSEAYRVASRGRDLPCAQLLTGLSVKQPLVRDSDRTAFLSPSSRRPTPYALPPLTPTPRLVYCGISPDLVQLLYSFRDSPKAS